MGSYGGVQLEVLHDALLRYLMDNLEEEFAVSEVHWLSGGASKLQMAFTLTLPAREMDERVRRLCVRLDPMESLSTTSRVREYQIIDALQGVVPVPRVFGLDEDGRWFPEPALIYDFMDGSTKSSRVEARVSGAGMQIPVDLRLSLGEQFVTGLAKIHSAPFDPSRMSAFTAPAVGTTDTALWQLNRAKRIWEEDRGEDWPLVELAANWISDNLPILDTPSLLHGDYRTGNFLFDEPTARITAWLDWERTYIGDRHRDLAWTTDRVFGNLSDDGEFLVCGLMPEGEFFARYQEISGLTIDPERLKFYRVLNGYQLVVSNLATAHRVVKLGKTHQDVVLAWLEGVVYSFARQIETELAGDFT